MPFSTEQTLTPTLADRPPAIVVQGLHKSYGALEAVKGIDFTVNPGEIFGLIGPDGAGKTTTFQILAGVMEATSGQVSILGKPPREARLNLGYVTQKFSLYLDLSIMENLRYSAGLRRMPEARFAERALDLLERVGLAAFGDRLAGQLSGGMKQKLALCCALIANPAVLLLDEPTTGVDPVSRREFWDLLAAVAAEGVTVVAATPYLDEAERCHRIGLIYGGEIQQMGTLSALREGMGLQRLEVRTADVVQAEQILNARASSEIVDIQTFGDRLDVLVTDAKAGEQQVRESLTHHQIRLDTVRLEAPTLENVFVNQLRQQGVDPAYVEFPSYRLRQEKGKVAIATQALQKNFGTFQAVKSVDLTVRYGEIYGLLGANGAGKTTTIKMLCGLLPASGGQIELAGETANFNRAEVRTDRSALTRSRIGYMSQKFTLYDDLTILQNLTFYCGVYGVPKRLQREKVNWVLETCGLQGQEQMLTGRLPGGWKQRVAFGASVMHEPDILFLDEPTSGVDPLARRQFWRLIRDFAQRGTAILVTTHYLEEAENCNYMGFMVAGQVVAQGSPSDIKANQPGQLIDLLTNHTQAASDLLKQRLEAWRVSIFGDHLHLVLDDVDRELPVSQQWLQDAGITVQSAQPIPFSLEDAFIGIVQRANAS
jgi:ABC-2 type transport system ATP-binding protein